jgi:hypothetical protein
MESSSNGRQLVSQSILSTYIRAQKCPYLFQQNLATEPHCEYKLGSNSWYIVTSPPANTCSEPKGLAFPDYFYAIFFLFKHKIPSWRGTVCELLDSEKRSIEGRQVELLAVAPANYVGERTHR